MKRVLKYIKRFIFVLCIFLSMYIIVTLIPTKFIEKSVKNTIIEGIEARYEVNILNKTILLDTYTDALILSTAYSLDPKSPIESFLLSRSNYKPGETKEIISDSHEKKDTITLKFLIPDFIDFMNGKIVTSYEYAKYWHGCITILKPLMMLFSYNGLRVTNFVINYILFVYLIYLLYKKKIKIGYILAIILSIIAVDIPIVFYCFEESITVTIMFIASIILLERGTRNINLFMMTVGMSTIFFEYISTPIFTYGFPIIIYILTLKNEDKSFKEMIKLVFKTGICWSLGYLILWVSKWILVDLLYDRGLILTALKEAVYRTDTLSFNILEVIKDNLYYLGRVVSICTIVVFAINILYTMFYIVKNKKLSSMLKNNLIYILLFLIPIIWWIVFANHSITHSYFTYRDFFISIICAELILVNYIERTKNKKIWYMLYVILNIVVIIGNYIIV